MNLKPWPPKDPREKVWATFKFIAALEVGETIVSAQIQVEVTHGSDETPANVLDGENQIIATNTVMQKLMGGNDKAVYLITCIATTSSGRVLVLANKLVIEKAH